MTTLTVCIDGVEPMVMMLSIACIYINANFAWVMDIGKMTVNVLIVTASIPNSAEYNLITPRGIGLVHPNSNPSNVLTNLGR
jgi:hypothetical protein